MHKMSTPTPTPTPTPTYPLYVKSTLFCGYNAYYLDPDDISSNIARSMHSREITSPSQNSNNTRQIGSITYYTTLPTLPTTTQKIYTLAGTYVEETTDPHIYIFYKKYKFLAVITLDNPDTLRHDNILTPSYTDVSPIQSTTAVIFNAPKSKLRPTYEQRRISLFDTTDRITYRGDTNVKPLGYQAILREDLLPPNTIVWNNYRFCKFSESDSSRATFLIDENDLKAITILFIADKKTNDVSIELISDTDFTDVVASYLDDDTADNLAVIKPLNNLAYTDKKILKSKTFYNYKGELING